MRRESHVRFCESVGVKLPHATHRNIYVRSQRAGERVTAVSNGSLRNASG
jgi:hypothetical protein